MGIYHMTTVGVGFEVPLEAIRAACPGTGKYGAEEALSNLLWEEEYKTLSIASAHTYDVPDSETTFAITVDRLTETYDDYDSFGLVILDGEPIDLTREEEVEVERIQRELGIYPAKVTQFVASSLI